MMAFGEKYGHIPNSKKCERCGSEYAKAPSCDSPKEWLARRFCSKKCVNAEIRSRKRITPIYERLMARTVKHENGCWIWTGAVDHRGYGTIASGIPGRPVKAHRVSYRHHHGAIKDGLGVCHHCDTPRCVNPAHLYAGTQKQNMHDAIERGRFKGHKNLELGRGRRI